MNNDREFLKEYLKENDYPNGRGLMGKSNKEVKSLILKETYFLDQLSNPKMSLRLHCIEHDIVELPTCRHPNCSNKVKSSVTTKIPDDFHYKIMFSKFCCSKCSAASKETKQKREDTNKELFGASSWLGSEEGKREYKQTMLERYGVEHSSQLPDFHEKRKETFKQKTGYEDWMHIEENKEYVKEKMLEKYGVENPTQSPEIFNKIKITNRDRYGVDYYVQSSLFRGKFIKTSLDRYGVEHPAKSKSVKEKTRKSNLKNNNGVLFNQRHLPQGTLDILNNKEKLKQIYDELGFIRLVSDELECDYSSVQRYMERHGIPVNQNHKSSIGEIEVASFIESLGFTVKQSDRKIFEGYEADIVVNEVPLIIEFNGVYWHSEKFKTKEYHQNKSLMAHDKGYSLIHVFEDDWNDDQRRLKIQDKIRSKLNRSSEKVYARKTKVGIPTKNEVKEIMDRNHIQGFTGYSLAFGLYEGNSLVACLTVKRTKDEGVYDLNRYATSKSVVGGMSKLISHIKKHLYFKEIFTYAHLDYSYGAVYEKSGFEREHITPPGMWYFKKGYEKRQRRERFMKHKLPNLFENVDMNKTEKEIMHENGYLRIFDAGSIRYSLKKD